MNINSEIIRLSKFLVKVDGIVITEVDFQKKLYLLNLKIAGEKAEGIITLKRGKARKLN